MKKFGKTLAAFMAVCMTLGLAACGGPNNADSSGSNGASKSSKTSSVTKSSKDGAEIAMITDVGTIDDKSFNQGTWEGVKKYAEEKKISHKYYKPTEKSTDAYEAAIELAIKGGAKIVVTPGFLFESPIYKVQKEHPDVDFVLVDGYPNDGKKKGATYKTEKNTVGVKYAEEQAGYLAGFAAVKEGYKKLGFMGGMAVPAVVHYGYGFIQGANAAAKEMNEKVDIKYHYTGGFEATPAVQTLSATWYQDGVQVIFACGGPVGNSVMAAAAAANPQGKVIGVDVDQSFESPTVITSAMKALSKSVYQILDEFYNNKFPGGQNLILNAANQGVQLPMKTSKFKKFTNKDYEEIYKQLSEGKIKLISGTDKDGKTIPISKIPAENVKVTEIK